MIIILFCLQGCTEEPLKINNLEIGEVNNSAPATGPPPTAGTSCNSTTIILQVEYLNLNITEDEKDDIRKIFESNVTLYEFMTSTACPNIEIWKVDCREYKACPKDCSTDPSTTVIKTPEDIIVDNCFGGGI